MDKKVTYLTAKEAAVALGLEIDMFRSLVSKGILPQPYTLTARLKMWANEDLPVMEWLLRCSVRLRKSTPDEEEAAAKD